MDHPGRDELAGLPAHGLGADAFGVSRSPLLSLGLLLFVGAGFMMSLAAANTFVQTIVEDRLRGRVMAFYSVAFLGTAPIGSLIAGVLASRAGPAVTIVSGGAACIAGALWFQMQLPRLRPLVRSVYVQQGIITLPDPDTGA